jgi:putative sterol carrier protein
VTTFLSDEWIQALDARFAAADAGTSPTPLTVQYVISTDSGERSYWLELGPDRDRAHVGTTDDAEVTFSMDEATALAMSNGELSTEEAFITGRLSLEGDAIAMIDAYRDATGA